MRRTFTLLCKGCGRRMVEAERIGEEEEATAAAHVAACFGLARIRAWKSCWPTWTFGWIDCA